jgi:hypothetical protein
MSQLSKNVIVLSYTAASLLCYRSHDSRRFIGNAKCSRQQDLNGIDG